MQRGRCGMMQRHQALWPEQLVPAAWPWLRLLRLSRQSAVQGPQEQADCLAGSCLRHWLSGPAAQPLQALLQRSDAAAAPWVPQRWQHGQERAAEQAWGGWGLLWIQATSHCEGAEAGRYHSHRQPRWCWLLQLSLHRKGQLVYTHDAQRDW